MRTKTSIERSDRESVVVTVEGLYEELRNADPKSYIPQGLTLIRSILNPAGGAFGVLTITCQKLESGFSFAAERTTFRVDMQEVQYDLEDHPQLGGDRVIVLKWLATDASRRVNNGYKYTDANGNDQEVTGEMAIAFCNAYMAGIKTFNRYFPVVEKISIYRNPPGLSMSGASFTGGSPDFSSGIGTYSDPPISLNGYSSGHWFKSKDSWQQSENRTWTRTEQWTYTPESSSGNHGWIYNTL